MKRISLAVSIVLGFSVGATPTDALAWSLKRGFKDLRNGLEKVAPAAAVIALPVLIVAEPKKVKEEAERVLDQADAQLHRSSRQLDKELDRAQDNVDREVKNGVESVVETVKVAGELAVDHSKLLGETGDSIWKAVEKGDVEAWVRAGTVDLWRGTEDLTADAMQESSGLRLVGQIGAEVVAPGVGGAAFAGWYGYHASGGDWGVALQSTAVTAATSWAKGHVTGIDGNHATDVAIRTTASGGVAAGATLIMGGDEKDARNAFLLGAGSQLASEWIASTTKRDQVDMSPPKEGPTIKPVDADIRAFSPQLSHIGLSVTDARNYGGVFDITSEFSPWMQGLGYVPGMNGMAYFHDIWMQETGDLFKGWKQVTIAPAMAATYLGSGVPTQQAVADQALE